jgi:glycosyltransferase involved in cell wall biosynthesis
MAMQRPVLATPQALGGIAAVPGEHVLSATSADQWTESLVDLLRDEAKQQQLGQAGRRFVRETYKWSQQAALLLKLLRDANTFSHPHSHADVPTFSIRYGNLVVTDSP